MEHFLAIVVILFIFLFTFARCLDHIAFMATKTPVLIVLILGHSFVRRLKSDLRAGFDARAAPYFGLGGAVEMPIHMGLGAYCPKRFRFFHKHKSCSVPAVSPSYRIGVHFNRRGQYTLYLSYHGALLHALRIL